MKHRILSIRPPLFVLCLFFCFASASPLDDGPHGAVNDFASLLSDQTKNSLEALSKALLEKTGVSCVLVTVKDLEGADINEAATKLFEKWGIGKRGVDEGILFFVSENDRKVRIETGYGSEAYVTDAQANRIINEIAPFFSGKQWDEGCVDAMVALAALAAKAHNTSLQELSGTRPSYGEPVRARATKVNIFGILFFCVLVLFLLSTRGGRSVLLFMLLSSLSSSGRSSGRGFGGGFGNGGFSGFGGGMSGGGGATGRF